MNSPVIYWYRQDLRIDDLPGLAAAMATGRPVLPCYILDDEAPGDWRIGAASRWWLHHSLASLASGLEDLGATLVLRRGETKQALQTLLEETGARDVFCTRMYEPWAAELEAALHEDLDAAGISFKRFGGALLFEPGSISNQSGKPYKVFTPFWRRCRASSEPPSPTRLTDDTRWCEQDIDGDALADWHLCPDTPDWAAGWEDQWQPGCAGAADALKLFLHKRVDDYSDGRDRPAQDSTSRLSPHLHYGEISPRTVWHTARRSAAGSAMLEKEVDKFLSELGWREFSYHLLHHFPRIQEQAFKNTFDNFPWRKDDALLQAWQRGRTGYPLVDAGMRELWQTGYMHNRVRMITASFLTKHLLIHWRRGADWFWDTLLDADLANNSCGWQWVAGSGADASPYFRIFNPVAQGEKFDADGDYIRRWVPEIGDLPDKYLHAPWETPEDVLAGAKIVLGDTYPTPLVEHKAAREAALAAYASIKE